MVGDLGAPKADMNDKTVDARDRQFPANRVEVSVSHTSRSSHSEGQRSLMYDRVLTISGCNSAGESTLLPQARMHRITTEESTTDNHCVRWIR